MQALTLKLLRKEGKKIKINSLEHFALLIVCHWSEVTTVGKIFSENIMKLMPKISDHIPDKKVQKSGNFSSNVMLQLLAELLIN